MKTFYSEQHVLRNPEAEFFRGRLVKPFETPSRMSLILERLQSDDPVFELALPEDFGLDPVLKVHDPDYLKFLETCWQDWFDAGGSGDAIAACWPTRRQNSTHIPRNIGGRLGYYGMATDTSICRGTWKASLLSKDVSLSATKCVLNGATGAFALCRPPGHHAAVDQYSGYCFLNNAAISAQYARDNGASRVAVLDVDFHHGNGTQQIFYDRNDVYFLSIHGDPMDAFPFFLGHEEETGTGPGEGYNRNYVFGPGTPYAKWRRALLDALGKVSNFAPDLLIISLGVDTFEQDPISFFKLKSDDFIDIGQQIAGVGLPTVFLMEGGYAIDDVGINVSNVLLGYQSEITGVTGRLS